MPPIGRFSPLLALQKMANRWRTDVIALWKATGHGPDLFPTGLAFSLKNICVGGEDMARHMPVAPSHRAPALNRFWRIVMLSVSRRTIALAAACGFLAALPFVANA